MAPKTTSDQIAALKNAGIRNMLVTNECEVHLKCHEMNQGDWQDLQQDNPQHKMFCLNEN